MSLLFLSHAAPDAAAAEFIERELRRLIPGLEVFRTSRVGQILPGDEWFQVVTDHLRSSDIYLILITPRSVDRPWMWFETGAAWMSSRPMIPVTASLAKADVPEPLRFFQLYALDDAHEAEIVLQKLGGSLPDAQMFCSAIRQLCAAASEEEELRQGWIGVQIDRYFVAIDGPIERFAEAAPIGASSTILNALKAANFQLMFAEPRSTANALARGYGQVWAIDHQFKRRHPLIEEHGQLLLGKSGS